MIIFNEENSSHRIEPFKPKNFYLPEEYMKIYEENSNLRYRVMKLTDQIMMLQESLGSSYKANLQKYFIDYSLF